MRFTALRVGFGKYRILDSMDELVLETIFDLKEANKLRDYLNLREEQVVFRTLGGDY